MQSLCRVAQSGALLTCFSLLCVANGVSALVRSGLSNYTFPDNFMFGVATAAFQIEGGWNAGGKGESVWDTYIHKHPDYTLDKSNGDVAADSYHKYKQDIIMVESLGVKYYRLSISWPRILPKGTDDYINEEGVKYYRRIFEGLLKANITPVVTLYHWDLPTPLMDLGGWANPKIIDYFEDYARVAFRLFGDVVKYWTTINEIHIHCYHGYGNDYFVPAVKFEGVAEYLCSHYMLLGHARVYHLYDKKFKPYQKGIIGITLDSFFAEPKDEKNSDDVAAAERYLQMRLGQYAHPIYSKEGNYPDLVRERINNLSISQGFSRSRLPVFTPQEVEMLRGSSDFFGLNHYTSILASSSLMEDGWAVPSLDHDTGVKGEQDPKWPIPGAPWLAVHPPGFRKLLNWITKQYGTKVPIIVTENGMSDSGSLNDYERVSYYNRYLEQLLLAIHEDGCNVAGYIAWTLMDDFEWKDGYSVKFGLFHVDYNSPKRTRMPKLSAINYREIVTTKRINFDYIKIPSYKYNQLL
ncbi:myrosinase 1-like isoform X1 [Pieris brassicae]|uniref:myrosinase 1-like isoform X1 n=2 Tax=Pieris brassicae TaxID=7116 RepID=UPI001E66224D|nr:myrosinase 1-like isoform X1 [Pieris brassicae]